MSSFRQFLAARVFQQALPGARPELRFPYLHGFKQRASGPNTIEYKIGEIYGEIKNKIRSGYNLREIIEHLVLDVRCPARPTLARPDRRTEDPGL